MVTTEREVQVWNGTDYSLAPFDFGADASVAVWQALGSEFTATMGAGIATYEGRFDWVLNYDTVYYFLEGSLLLTHGDATHRAQAGDIMFIPRGAEVTYESPDGCRIFWAILPGNWEEISDFSVARDGKPNND